MNREKETNLPVRKNPFSICRYSLFQEVSLISVPSHSYTLFTPHLFESRLNLVICFQRLQKGRNNNFIQKKTGKLCFNKVMKVNFTRDVMQCYLPLIWWEGQLTSKAFSPKTCNAHLIGREKNQTILIWGTFYKISDQYSSKLWKSSKWRKIRETFTTQGSPRRHSDQM